MLSLGAKLVIRTVAITTLVIGAAAIGYELGSKPDAPSSGVPGDIVVMRTKGGLLEVSRIQASETITQTFPGLFFDTDVTVTVPATYRYHVELALEWKLFRQGSLFIVVAPYVKPSLPVAIDTNGMNIQTNLPFTNSTKLQAAKQITPLLDQKAVSYIPRQREDARKTIGEFITKWVVNQSDWKAKKDLRVVVLFPDEPVNEVFKAGLYPIQIPKDVNPQAK